MSHGASNVPGRSVRTGTHSVVAAIATILLFTSCGSTTGLDIDEDDLSTIPRVNALDFSRIEPAEPWDYWELRHAFAGPGDSPDIRGSGGPLSRDELAPETVEALNAAQPVHGFATGCLPAHCFDFIAAVRNGVVELITTRDSLRLFLGEIGTFEEATLLVHAHGYTWSQTEPGSGYTPLGQHRWEFVVFELVDVCQPVQTDRVQLQVRESGQVVVLGRETWSRDPLACI